MLHGRGMLFLALWTCRSTSLCEASTQFTTSTDSGVQNWHLQSRCLKRHLFHSSYRYTCPCCGGPTGSIVHVHNLTPLLQYLSMVTSSPSTAGAAPNLTIIHMRSGIISLLQNVHCSYRCRVSHKSQEHKSNGYTIRVHTGGAERFPWATTSSRL
jgi:hypothetical protein